MWLEPQAATVELVCGHKEEEEEARAQAGEAHRAGTAAGARVGQEDIRGVAVHSAPNTHYRFALPLGIGRLSGGLWRMQLATQLS